MGFFYVWVGLLGLVGFCLGSVADIEDMTKGTVRHPQGIFAVHCTMANVLFVCIDPPCQMIEK